MTPTPLTLHPDRALPVDDRLRGVAREIYGQTAAWPLICRFAQSQSRFAALENGILQGRKPVGAWRVEADARWKRYGQRMSEELAQAYVDAGRG